MKRKPHSIFGRIYAPNVEASTDTEEQTEDRTSVNFCCSSSYASFHNLVVWQVLSLLWSVQVGWLQKLRSRNGTGIFCLDHLSVTTDSLAESEACQVFVNVA